MAEQLRSSRLLLLQRRDMPVLAAVGRNCKELGEDSILQHKNFILKWVLNTYGCIHRLHQTETHQKARTINWKSGKQ